jgi:alpha-1,3-rhamnosyl/mannosyltransferase
VLEHIARLKLEQRVRFLGYRPVDEMPALYEGASALVFPSMFEGFGMPLVEAMWCDCPVVCSNTTSLPEIAGDAAMQVDPSSPDELASALARVLTDDALRQDLVARGRRRAPRFSWSRFTLDTVRILHDTHCRC